MSSCRVPSRLRSGGILLASLVLTAACGTTVPGAAPGTVLSRSAGGFGESAPGDLAGTDGMTGGTSGSQPGQGGTGMEGSLPAGTGGGQATGTQVDPAGTATGSSPSRTGGATGAQPSTGERLDRTLLKVGVTYNNTDATNSALGFDDGSAVNQKAIIRALVKGVNARGGLQGRPLQVVEYEWNQTSENYSLDAATACETFTRDNKVALVLDTAFGVIAGFRECIAKAGIPVLQSSNEGDDTASRNAPLHANTNGMTVDRNYAAVLQGLSASGYLNRRNKVGVILEDCPYISRAYNRTLAPALSKLGQQPELTMLECTTGFDSAGAAGASVNNAILRFRRAAVDRVLMVSDFEAVVLLLFAQSAESQGYRPGFMLSSQAQAQVLRSQLPAGQQPQMRGVGGSRFGDVDDGQFSAPDRVCDSLARAGGLAAATYTAKSLLVALCGPFLLLDAALKQTGGSAETANLMAAVASLGTSFAAPGLVDDATRYSSTFRDGPERVREFAFAASCTCIRYTGVARAVPRSS